METKKEFYFPSSDGKTQIHAVAWLPYIPPVGVLQIVHGIAEYALRYEPFARFMNARGMVVVANDHLGHGLSLAEGAPRLYFAKEHGWQHVVDDIYALRNLTVQKYPSLPYFLMGHSMGSFLTRTYLIQHPGTVSAAIIMGTGQNTAATITAGRLLARLLSHTVGAERSNGLIEKLAFGSYNKVFAPNRTPYDWLSVNEENVDRYLADPLCGGRVSIGLFLDMLSGIQLIQNPHNLSAMDRLTPVLFISGDHDPVGGMGKGVKAAFQSFRQNGVQDLTLKLYEGLRHEILNEACSNTVYQDLWAWISQHM